MTLWTAARPAVAQPTDRFARISELVAERTIDEEQALVYRLYSVRAPERLPAELQALPRPTLDCATPLFLEAYQRRARGTLSPWALGAVTSILARPTSAGYYDSDTHPLRVHYPRSGLMSMARDVLDAANHSWDVQCGDMNFREPLPDLGEDGSDRLDIYVGDAGGAAGYTAPEYTYPDTANADCTVSIVIEESLWEDTIGTTVAHELNHAMQAEYDCLEWQSWWENTASYIMDLTYDSVNDYIYWLPEFQGSPGSPFELFEDYGAYQYGGALVAMVIDEAFGSGDGTAVSRVWEVAKQNSEYNNEPDYLDGLADVVGVEGEAAVDLFAQTLTEWRYMTGGRDDSEHLSEAYVWDSYMDGCDVNDNRRISSLPTSGTITNSTHIHGSSYVRIDLGSRKSGVLDLEFSGDADTRWAISTICFGSSPTGVTPVYVTTAQTARASVEVFGNDACTLAVSDLAPEGYDPDNDFSQLDNATHSYTYSFAFREGAHVEATCGCNTVTDVCDEGCTCDPDCGACACDQTYACDDGCECDPECEGCNCAAASAGPLLAVAALLLLARRLRRRA